MINKINEYDFLEAFKALRPDNFTTKGLKSLFEYLEDLEDDTGTTIELDVIALCCDYLEYESLEEFQNDYGKDYKTLEDIQETTTVIEVDDNRFIIQAF